MASKEHWDADYASGEPAMPADHLIDREGSLYVDFFSDGEDVWWAPDNARSTEAVKGMAPFASSGALHEVEESLIRIETAQKNGILTPISLRVLHEEFSGVHIASLKTTAKEVRSIYGHVFDRLEKEGIHLDPGIRSDNALVTWPLYSIMK